jgi:hypothetical protein
VTGLAITMGAAALLTGAASPWLLDHPEGRFLIMFLAGVGAGTFVLAIALTVFPWTAIL